MSEASDPEVLCVCGEDPVGPAYDGLCRDCWLGLCACTEETHPRRTWDIDPESVEKLIPEGKRPVVIPLSLAQRILAALDATWMIHSKRREHPMHTLAAELRAALSQEKP